LKTIICIILAFAAILMTTIPVSADGANGDITTSVTVISGGSSPPVIKALWAHDGGTDVTSETADPTHTTPGVQILPTQGYEASHDITFVAIVTDENGLSNITHVYADIFNPDGSLKFEVELMRHGSDDFAKSLFDNAYNAGPQASPVFGMTTVNIGAIDPAYGRPIDKDEIDTELDQQLAATYWSTYHFDNCQLAGTYGITINAFNWQTVVGSFGGSFDWMPLTAAEFDFNAVNYGSVTMGVHKQKPGDSVWDTTAGANPATIRNIGNTYLRMTIKQDDMGFGKTVINGIDTWNVAYDFRLGDGDIAAGSTMGYVNYLPSAVKITGTNVALNSATPYSSLQILNLCSTVKVDFSIQVNKDLTPGTAKTGTMIIGAANANLPYNSTNPAIIGTPVLPNPPTVGTPN